MSGALRLKLFGGFRLELADGTPIAVPLRKAEALLAYLALSESQSASRERLATLLWGDFNPTRARQNLRQVVFALTKVSHDTESPLLQVVGQNITLRPEGLEVDANLFLAHLASGRREDLHQALALYSGELLSGFLVDAEDFEEWLAASRDRYRELAIKVALDLVEREEQAGKLDRAIECAGAALRIEPLREDIHRRLMRLYCAKGMRSSALAQYRLCAGVLQRELGVDPDGETRELYAEVLRQGAAEAGGQTSSAAERWPGTRPATEAPKLGPVPSPLALQDIRVGRHSELARLDEALAAAGEGVPRLLVISGAVGSGRSHLVDSFLRRLAMPESQACAVRVRDLPPQRPLVLWSEVLDAVRHLRGEAPFQQLSKAAQERLARLSRGELAFTASASGSVGGQALFEAVLALVRRLGEPTPMVLAFDDLDHADAASLRLLARMVTDLDGSGLLILATAAGDARATPGPFALALERVAAAGRLEELPLAALPPEDARALVGRATQELGLKVSSAERARLKRAENNGLPGPIIEVLLSILGVAGSERRTPAGFAEDDPAEDVIRLLQGLSETGRRLAYLAAVLGPQVDPQIFEGLARLEAGDFASGVEELVESGLLSSEAGRLSFLSRQAWLLIYSEVVPPRRRLLHREAGRAIEAAHAGDLKSRYRDLSYHAQRAGDELAALRYEMLAGDAHAGSGRLEQAAELYAHTLQRLSGPVDAAAEALVRLEVELRHGLAQTEERRQDLAAAAVALQPAEKLLEGSGPAELRAKVFYLTSRIRYQKGDRRGALDHARRALAAAERSESECVWLPAERLPMRIHLVTGAYDNLVERIERKRATCGERGELGEALDAAASLALLHGLRGRFAQADEEARCAVAFAEKLGSEPCLGACLQVLGMVESWRGNTKDAIAAYHKAQGVAEVCGDLPRLYVLRGYLGGAYLVGEQAQEAITCLREARLMGDELATRFNLALFTAWLAEALFDIGEVGDALEMAREAFHMAAETNHAWARSVALRALARALAHAKHQEGAGAEKAIRSALAAQQSFGFKVEVARSLVSHAKILRAGGDVGRSSLLYARASELFDQMGMRHDHDRARTMAEALRPREEQPG